MSSVSGVSNQQFKPTSTSANGQKKPCPHKAAGNASPPTGTPPKGAGSQLNVSG
jgi:hypothetical protein